MKPINPRDLHRLHGGGDPIDQPLTMPPGWTPVNPADRSWIFNIGDYLKYIAAPLAK
ncbi:MAG TPA: hypothetical protein VHD32_11400 [Candidatus Didemnitutus sp.]|nr:hypothetical protein [Candidatus Didemnitutus sp.]